MDDVVKACGMSKKTVYRNFGTKENLFSALIDTVICESVRLEVTLEDQPADLILSDMLSKLTSFVLSERQISILRLVIAESASAPELAAAFHENGLMRCKAWVSDLLSALQASGKLNTAHPRELASVLVGAILGDSLITALIRRPQPMAEKEREARIALLMDLVRPALIP
jgi:TetR/AcrR family transcriptional repressor of mexJK operon